MHVFKCQPWVILRKKKKKKLHRAIHQLRLVSIISKWMKNSFMRNTDCYMLQLSGGREHFWQIILFQQNYVYSNFLIIRCLRILWQQVNTIFLPRNWHPRGFQLCFLFFFNAVCCLDCEYCFWLKESVRPLRGVSELLFELLCVDGVP